MKTARSLFVTLLPVFAVVTLSGNSDAAGSRASTVSEVAAYLSKKSGMRILVSAQAVNESARMPAEDEKVTAENVEGYIQYLVQNMREGAVWSKLHMPDPPKGKAWTAEDVIAFAVAQAKLYSPVGAPREDGKVEILSQLLPADKAKSVIDALGLKPVYVITAGRGTFAGVWDATFGELTLRVFGNRVVGNYTSNQGEITGTLSGDVLRFRWLERGNGTSGQGIWTLSKDGDSFKGTWMNDGDSGSVVRVWSGTRVKR